MIEKKQLVFLTRKNISTAGCEQYPWTRGDFASTTNSYQYIKAFIIITRYSIETRKRLDINIQFYSYHLQVISSKP